MKYDVIVVGAGLTGTSVAQDCALRGLDVLLLDAGDIGCGASGMRPGLLDAEGLGCQVQRQQLIRQEVELLLQSAGHIMRRLPIVWPLMPHLCSGHLQPMAVRGAVALAQCPAQEEQDAYWGELNGAELRQFEPALSETFPRAIVTAGWWLDVQRLIQLLVRSAEVAGVEIKNHTRVVGLVRDVVEGDDVIGGVETLDIDTGETGRFYAQVVVNAAGAEAQELAQLAGSQLPLRQVRELSLVYSGRCALSAVFPLSRFEQGVRIIPRSSSTWVGSVFLGEGASKQAQQRALSRLRSVAEQTLPELKQRRLQQVNSTQSARWGGGDLTRPRPSVVYDHAAAGAKGLLTVIGGAVAEYRFVAERTGDLVARATGCKQPSRTDVHRLPGGEGFSDPVRWAQQFSISLQSVTQMISRHGARSHEILQESDDLEGGANLVCRCQSITKAELHHAVEQEFAHSLSGLMRRTGIGQGPCQGSYCLPCACSLLRETTGLSAREYMEHLCAAKQELFAKTQPVFANTSSANFLLDQMSHGLTGNLDRYHRFCTDAEGVE